MAGPTTLISDGLPADQGRKPVVLPRLGARAALDKKVILRIAWGWLEARAFHVATESLPNQRGTAPKHPGLLGQGKPVAGSAANRRITR